MDSIVQLKNNLISRIENAEDLSFLRVLQMIFDSSEQASFELNEQQRKSIAAGREEIKNGTFKAHEQVMSEMKTWLKKQ